VKAILDQKLQQVKPKIDEIVKDLHDLTIDIKADEISQMVSDLRNRINEP